MVAVCDAVSRSGVSSSSSASVFEVLRDSQVSGSHKLNSTMKNCQKCTEKKDFALMVKTVKLTARKMNEAVTLSKMCHGNCENKKSTVTRSTVTQNEQRPRNVTETTHHNAEKLRLKCGKHYDKAWREDRLHSGMELREEWPKNREINLCLCIRSP